MNHLYKLLELKRAQLEIREGITQELIYEQFGHLGKSTKPTNSGRISEKRFLAKRLVLKDQIFGVSYVKTKVIKGVK